jgi:hypothetical protein
MTSRILCKTYIPDNFRLAKAPIVRTGNRPQRWYSAKQKQKRGQSEHVPGNSWVRQDETKCPVHLGDDGNTSKQCEVNWCTARGKMT